MSKENGGPAFPVVGAGGAPEDYPGMTLRDYFAAKAMPILLQEMENPNPSDVAEWTYRHADAMLAERSEP